jgi:hydrogenase nickel incorporation protein HypA/HybF
MHESALAKRVLELVLDRARAEGARRVTRVRGYVAETEALAPESLAFHFAAHAKGTAADGARLELELVRVSARCRACGEGYTPDHHVILCPRCESTEAELTGRTGVGIVEIDVE